MEAPSSPLSSLGRKCFSTEWPWACGPYALTCLECFSLKLPRNRHPERCDFFDLACSLWLESSEEHLPTSIAGVLRLRAISRPLCDRSARRFAQDDGFVVGEKHPVSYAENTKRSKKSQALRMTILWELSRKTAPNELARMGVRPSQHDEKRLGPAATFHGSALGNFFSIERGEVGPAVSVSSTRQQPLTGIDPQIKHRSHNR